MTTEVSAKLSSLYYEMRIKAMQLRAQLNEIEAPGVYGPEGMPGLVILHSVPEALELISDLDEQIADYTKRIEAAPFEKRYKRELDAIRHIAVKHKLQF